MTLAVVRTLSTNKQSNEQKETKNSRFQHDDNKYGNGSWVNFIELEAQKRVPGIRKKETHHCRIRRHETDQIKAKKLIPA